MSFADELSLIFNVDTMEPSFKMIVLNDCYICIEGIYKIIDFSVSEIILDNVLGKRIRLAGSNFVIIKLEKNEIYLKGEVCVVEYI